VAKPMRERLRSVQIGLDLNQKLNDNLHRKQTQKHALLTRIFETEKVLSLGNPRKKRYLPKTIYIITV
jgi:hypothetical protein